MVCFPIWGFAVSALCNVGVNGMSFDIPAKRANLINVENRSGNEADDSHAVLPEWDTDIWMLFGIQKPKMWKSYLPPGHIPHPIWQFDEELLERPMVIVCCIVIFLAGILCFAGGIGGGGIYVMVLMVAGRLPIEDAVPISKAIIFIGSLASLVVNMVRGRFSSSAAPNLIDLNICRIVVPTSLAGTSIGVFLNRLLPGWFISLVLTVLLFAITCITIRTAVHQRTEECEELQGSQSLMNTTTNETERGISQPCSETPSPKAQNNGNPGNTGRVEKVKTYSNDFTKAMHVAQTAEMTESEESAMELEVKGMTTVNHSILKHSIPRMDPPIFFSILFIVIFCATLRYHVQSCRFSPPRYKARRCHHPVLKWMGPEALHKIVSKTWSATFVHYFALFFPLVVCLSVAVIYSRMMTSPVYGWKNRHTIKYLIMAFTTGVLCGIIGIGGGLIFCPFFITMGVPPAVAVATSTTCVIFVSASTAIQYVLMDRVIISLTIVYGAVNIIASILGTSLVHYLHNQFPARKSFITMIVGCGVFASMVLAAVDLGHHFYWMHEITRQ